MTKQKTTKFLATFLLGSILGLVFLTSSPAQAAVNVSEQDYMSWVSSRTAQASAQGVQTKITFKQGKRSGTFTIITNPQNGSQKMTYTVVENKKKARGGFACLSKDDCYTYNLSGPANANKWIKADQNTSSFVGMVMMTIPTAPQDAQKYYSIINNNTATITAVNGNGITKMNSTITIPNTSTIINKESGTTNTNTRYSKTTQTIFSPNPYAIKL